MAYKIQILPRWIIFLLDLCCIEFCMFFAFALRFNFNLTDAFSRFNIPLTLGLALIINATLFYILKSFAGIIRYTNMEDAFRLLMVNALASGVYFVMDMIHGNYLLFPITIIAINFFTINFALISYRFLVRYSFRFYAQFRQEDVVRTKAAIYNSTEHGLLTKKVMSGLPDGGGLQVIAFLDDTGNKAGKQMEGVPIWNTDDDSFERLKNEGVELLIVANQAIPKEKLNYLVDKCLNYGIRVQQVPPIERWLNGKLGAEQLKNINIEDLLEREVIRIDNEKLLDEIKGKKILVTGAAGSIGSELVRQLVKYKPSLLILCDKAETPLHYLQLEMQEHYKDASFKAYIGDICDSVRMEHLFEIYNPNIVFHAAAYKHVPLMEDNPSVAVLNNILGTKIISELSVANGVEKFVMVSTDKAVNPTNIMGTSKRIAEIFTNSYYKHLARTADANGSITRFVTTRFGNVLGSNGSVIPRFREQLEKGGPITVTHPEITRFFMTIPEACQLVIEAGAMGKGGEIFVFDMGQPVKIVDLARKMIRLSGKVPDVDIPIVFTGLRPGEKLYEELLNDSENVLPTYHHKIMIARVREYDFTDVNDRINKLISSARRHYTIETVAQMKDLVPEFTSNNSFYENKIIG